MVVLLSLKFVTLSITSALTLKRQRFTALAGSLIRRYRNLVLGSLIFIFILKETITE
jgi:hypothetical protein